MMTIEEKLRSLWHQERRFYHVRGASRFILWLIAMLAVDFIIDWGILFRVNSNINIGLLLLIVNIGVLGYVLWNEWLKYLKPFDPVVVALEVETRHPELASVLVSYTQFPEGTRDEHASPELVEAMRQQARDLTRTIDFREVVDFAQIRKLLMVCACITFFFLIISINWQAHTSSLLRRLSGVDATYPTRTQIVDVSGDLMVRAGDPVIVTVGAEGVIPEQGTIYVRSDESGSDWQTAPMLLGGAGSGRPVFEQTLDEVNEELLYYIKLGDDRSDLYRITPISAPSISAVRIDRTYLPYLGREADKTSALSGSVLEGSSLVWHLTTHTPVDRLQVAIGEKRIDAVQNGDNLHWTFRMDKVKSSFKYTFLWTEGMSGKGFEYDDVEHAMEVIPDMVPKVELLKPTLNALATVNKRVTIKAKVQDDHGLDEAWLTYTVNDGEEKRIPIEINFKGQQSGIIDFVWNLKDTVDDVKPDMNISFYVQVKDHYPNGESHEAGSVRRRLSVVDAKRYIDWYQEELSSNLNDVRRAQVAEEEAAKALKQLKIQEGVE
ncbi:MAG: hypothetical protein QGH15_06060 [Kiritimatiellia bacterium]|nr:hypothetical protein [Kiritimatiellia bacterium]